MRQKHFTEKEAFQHLWPCIFFICLVSLNTALVFLELFCRESHVRASMLKITSLELLRHENLSSALQITLNVMRKKDLSCT